MDYFPLFALGIVAFQWFSGICAKWETVVMLLAAGVTLYIQMGALITLVGFGTAIVIVAMPFRTNAPLALLGTLSYSIYLLHVPVGGRIINLAQRIPPSAMVAVGGIAAAAAITFGGAFVLYRLVEKPAHDYARSLRVDQEVLIRQERMPA